jgi:hypothetical protein
MKFFGWMVGSGRFGAARRPGRQPRLAVIDAAKVDERRLLILIRRDNVEHLLMIGGPTDIVVEPNVVRATEREPALARPPLFAQATQRSAVVANEGAWLPQLETALTVPTLPRPQRQAHTAEEPLSQDAEAESPLPTAPRERRPIDRLTPSAEEVALEPRVAREEEALTEPQSSDPVPPQNAPAEAVFNPGGGPNLDKLIEAALRRRRKGDGLRHDAGFEAKPGRAPTETQTEPQPEAEVEREPVLGAPAAEETELSRGDAKLGRDVRTTSRRPISVYDSFEQDMTNLLGGATTPNGNEYPIRHIRRVR